VGQLVVQFLVAISAVVWSGVITLIIGLALKYTMGWRVDRDSEVEGIDINVHGEAAYDLIGGGGRQVQHASAALSSEVEGSATPVRVSEEVTA
jgi:Amt family ammonium transporter